MYFRSQGASCGRNQYIDIDNGTMVVKYANKTRTIVVERGNITEVINKEGDKKEHIVYGEFMKEYKRGKLIKTLNYRSGTNSAIIPSGECTSIKTKLEKYRGTLTQKSYGGSRRAERFTYNNGTIAYKIYAGQKRGKVFYPNGKVWAEFEGTPEFAWTDTVFLSKEKLNLISMINIEFSNDRGWRREQPIKRTNFEVTVYDLKGKVQYYAKRENNQNSGVWINDYIEHCFLKGIPCPRPLYDTPPEQLNSREIMDIQNIQLRSALCERKGYESILRDLEGKEVDREGEYSLFELPIPKPENDRADKVLKLLKVRCTTTGAYYTLRVPPECTKVEQAREWTFGAGLNEENADQRVFDLQIET